MRIKTYNSYLSCFVVCLLVTLVSNCITQARTKHLWDKEPLLTEAAKSVTITDKIHPTDPQRDSTKVRLSTQEMKITLWGPPDRPTLSLGKTDVWDRRIIDQPIVSRDDILKVYKDGRVPPINYYTGFDAYDFPCPKPVGQVIILCPDFKKGAQPTAVTSCADGTTTLTIEKDKTKAVITYLPMMDYSNIIAIRASFTNLTQPVSVRLYRHKDTTHLNKRRPGGNAYEPKAFLAHDYSKDTNNGLIDPPKAVADKTFFWIEQVLPADRTFPHGFWVEMVAKVVSKPVEIEVINGQKGLGTAPYLNAKQQKIFDNKLTTGWPDWGSLPNYKEIRDAPGSAATATLPAGENIEFTLLVNVCTMAEAADPLSEAKQRIALAEKKGFVKLREENARWYAKLYKRREHGRVFKGNAEYTTKQIPKIFRSWNSAHHSWCLSNPKRYEQNANYALMEQDWANWHGMYCYNEFYPTPHNVANQTERWSFYYNLADFWWEAARRNTRDMFGTSGVAIVHGYLPPIEPTKYFNSHSQWGFCVDTAPQLMKVLWDRYDYTGDEDYLIENLYPKMKDVANFCADYVTKGDDGYYHIIPAVSAEHYGWTENMARNKDTTSALCMFKWQLKTTANAAEFLGVDKRLRKKWRHIADNLLPYPMFQTEDGPIFSDMPGTNPLAINYNWYPGVYPCTLADEINLDSPPELKEIMIRTASMIKGWANYKVLPLLGVRQSEQVYGLKNIKDTPERMLNSRSGRIHLFPAVELNETVAFKDFQARGGFLVTAERIDGKTTYLEITARRSIPCRVMNPWPGEKVIIIDKETKAEVPYTLDTSNGECIIFPAQKGRCYIIAGAHFPKRSGNGKR